MIGLQANKNVGRSESNGRWSDWPPGVLGMTIQFLGTDQSKRTVARLSIAAAGVMVLLSACSPTVKVQAPDKPIVINLNVKIEQEIRVKVEKEIDDLLLKNKDLF